MGNQSVNRIFLRIVRNRLGNAKDYTYIILGRPGKTGKTWLCNELRVHGFNAFEISEDIYDLVRYNDEENHVMVNNYSKQVTIVLNKLIKRTRRPQLL